MLVEEGFVPVRHDAKYDQDSSEWFDMKDFSHILEVASLKASKTDGAVPKWAAEYPFERIAAVVVIERAEYERLRELEWESQHAFQRAP